MSGDRDAAICPTCHQPVAMSALLVDPTKRHVALGHAFAALTPREMRVFMALFESRPSPVSRADLQRACDASTRARSAPTSRANLDTAIFALRTKLAHFPLTIGTCHGTGLYLTVRLDRSPAMEGADGSERTAFVSEAAA